MLQSSPHGGQYDLAVIPVSKSGDAEFTRDVLQAAFQALDDRRPLGYRGR